MRSTFAPLAFAALALASPAPQATQAPSSPPPAGCSANYQGQFGIEIVKVASNGKRSVEKRQHTPLTISLSNGVLTDSQGRTGYVAANSQFQFDSPVQAGAQYNSGFSICANGSLAIGNTAVWQSCLSGTFDNLYLQNSAAQCSQVYILAVGGGKSASSAYTFQAMSTTVAAQQSDGQVTGTAVTSAAVTSAAVCTEYKDGQPQCSSSVPVASAAACTQYVDGQPQCSSAAAPITTSAAACTEYVDGQPQCSSAAAPLTTSAAACTQYVDGQPQCSSNIPYGNATYYPSSTYSAVPATNAGATQAVGQQILGLAAGVFAVALL